MKKVDLYSLIHKAQRKHLFDLSIRIGQTNFEEPTQAAEVKKNIISIIDHLYAHSRHEETFIHPLYSNFTNETIVRSIISEHESLEQILEEMRKSLDDNIYENLYSKFNKFIALYLIHIDKEEEAQAQILWQHFSNEDLAEVMKKFQASLSIEEKIENFKFMLPACGVTETSSILNQIKASAPDSFYQEIWKISKDCNSPNKWNEIIKKLA